MVVREVVCPLVLSVACLTHCATQRTTQWGWGELVALLQDEVEDHSTIQEACFLPHQYLTETSKKSKSHGNP
jgi:hypothetical protein